MAALGEHPRLARMVLTSARLSCEPLGCMLAALISEGDFLRNAGDVTADVAPRLRMLLDPGSRPGECVNIHEYFARRLFLGRGAIGSRQSR
jgi:HrpA-like RNA helicase